MPCEGFLHCFLTFICLLFRVRDVCFCSSLWAIRDGEVCIVSSDGLRLLQSQKRVSLTSAYIYEVFKSDLCFSARTFLFKACSNSLVINRWRWCQWLLLVLVNMYCWIYSLSFVHLRMKANQWSASLATFSRVCPVRPYKCCRT